MSLLHRLFLMWSSPNAPFACILALRFLIQVYPGALSLATSTFISPVVVAICRRRSPRVVAVLGGLLSALGCLFTSFATQFHQIFVSWCFGKRSMTNRGCFFGYVTLTDAPSASDVNASRGHGLVIDRLVFFCASDHIYCQLTIR